jgi:hypothetical protein
LQHLEGAVSGKIRAAGALAQRESGRTEKNCPAAQFQAPQLERFDISKDIVVKNKFLKLDLLNRFSLVLRAT